MQVKYQQLIQLTVTVDESGSLNKTIRVDIMFGASSTRYNLLFLKKYPIRYELDLLIAACSHKLSTTKKVWRTKYCSALSSNGFTYYKTGTWISLTPFTSSDMSGSTPSSSITKTTVSAAFLAEV